MKILENIKPKLTIINNFCGIYLQIISFCSRFRTAGNEKFILSRKFCHRSGRKYLTRDEKL